MVAYVAGDEGIGSLSSDRVAACQAQPVARGTRSPWPPARTTHRSASDHPGPLRTILQRHGGIVTMVPRSQLCRDHVRLRAKASLSTPGASMHRTRCRSAVPRRHPVFAVASRCATRRSGGARPARVASPAPSISSLTARAPAPRAGEPVVNDLSISRDRAPAVVGVPVDRCRPVVLGGDANVVEAGCVAEVVCAAE